ncbi:uncharacterized protein LY89DRAFT_678904 [Mollisia scopiformis]|uniref:Uncharacterized protein n=1 Tax=Mollisia scopiformis TaxID=149040 RepID=A0A132B1U3_MOLSC|nr:uncharacterized protein LY89DRAFT_678904 [Mollisia scopiformis]KUJ06358.1 hypothetical protein LY89DRAFT_678904 [Mollisia scopiformis]
MTYSTYAFYLGRLGKDTGLEDKLISYCFRRGTANAVNGVALEADAPLESDISDDGLTRAFTHMSIRCNPGAPKEVPREVMDPLLAADPEIVNTRKPNSSSPRSRASSQKLVALMSTKPQGISKSRREETTRTKRSKKQLGS